ncbi:MAG: GAF domain-containing protein [Leptonema illini]|nr:MAG: GAF domain-containing protein [Leptonema illini]
MASLRRFLYRRWSSFLAGMLIIAGYTYLQSAIFLVGYEQELATVIFVVLAVVILIPVRDYLLEPFLTFPSWETLIETQQHHLEFLARPFTLQTLLNQIMPDLMIWLRIPDARLFILQQERRFFDMHVYRRGALKGSRRITRKNVIPITRMFRQFGRVARREDPTVPEHVEKIMAAYRIAIAVPFIHRGRLLGMLIFHHPTQNRHAERGLELFAAKAAITIHDHILKSRMQNIAEYDEELRIATKIRQMLQMQEAPEVPGWVLKTGRIRSATLIEYFHTNDRQYAVLLSTKAAGGVQAMILSGALGYLFATVRIKGPSLRLSSLLRRMQQYTQENDLTGKLEILVVGLRPGAKEMTVASMGRSYRLLNEDGEETALPPGRTTFRCRPDSTISLHYQDEEILSFSKLP